MAGHFPFFYNESVNERQRKKGRDDYDTVRSKKCKENIYNQIRR